MFDLRKNHILQAIVFVIFIWLVVTLKAVLAAFFIAFLFTTVLHPVVSWLKRRHFPTALAVLLPIVGVIVLLVLVGYFIVPQVTSETQRFSDQVPGYIKDLKHNGLNLHINVKSVTSQLQQHFGTISGLVISATKTALEIIVGAISIIVVTLYWLGSYDRVQQTLLSYVPARSRERAADIWARIEKKLVSWLVAQALLGIVIGVLVWIGALIIGLPFAGALGVIAGLLEVIPTLGPIASAIPGVLLALTISWKTAVAALVMYLIVHQLENHIFSPWLLGRTVRLSPIIVIFALLVGATLYGILGALLAVPVALVISAFVDSYRDGAPKLVPTSAGGSVKATNKKDIR